MKSFLIFLVGVALGGAAALFVLPGLLIGAGAGAGIATGLKAGTCLTAEAALDKGYIGKDQVGELIAAAGQKILAQNVASDDESFASGDAKCQEFIAKLKTENAGAK